MFPTEKISWTGRVKNEEALRKVGEDRNVLHVISRQRANWIGHIAYELSYKTRYWQKDRGNGISDGKTRKKV